MSDEVQRFIVWGDSILTEEQIAADYARWVLDLHKGNKTHAAKALGIDRRSLYRRLGYKYKSDEGRSGYAPSNRSRPE